MYVNHSHFIYVYNNDDYYCILDLVRPDTIVHQFILHQLFRVYQTSFRLFMSDEATHIVDIYIAIQPKNRRHQYSFYVVTHREHTLLCDGLGGNISLYNMCVQESWTTTKQSINFMVFRIKCLSLVNFKAAKLLFWNKLEHKPATVCIVQETFSSFQLGVCSYGLVVFIDCAELYAINNNILTFINIPDCKILLGVIF